MAKITYLLGAGASYNSCPILDRQAEMMINVARNEISNLNFDVKSQIGSYDTKITYNFIDTNYLEMHSNNEFKILWYIGYFGEKAKEYNTIDTYARKLYLNEEYKEYNLLKMSVSIFFDIWESYVSNYTALKEGQAFHKIDNRYKSLFSILLDRKDNSIKLNDDFKFITWNYDLQLEQTYKLFLGEHHQKDLDTINKSFKFKEDNDNNDVFHLNGHRGFYKDKSRNEEPKDILLNISDNKEEYWKNLDSLYESINRKFADFNNHIKYAWEHNLNDTFFNNISKVLQETEVLVIIGYSFPAFNREIDQFLFKQLSSSKIKKIVYQDPNATSLMIENLLENPKKLKDKIEILNDQKDLNQFYLPNEHFISQTKHPNPL
ncbi:hypothetical protein [Flavobacterium sp.]